MAAPGVDPVIACFYLTIGMVLELVYLGYGGPEGKEPDYGTTEIGRCLVARMSVGDPEMGGKGGGVYWG